MNQVKLFGAILSSACITLLASTAGAQGAPAKMPTATPPVAASRAPEKGCTWKKIELPSRGLSVIAEDCNFGSRQITNSFTIDALEEKYSDSPTGDKLIEVFTNESGEEPAVALGKQFISHLSEYEQKHCVVRKAAPKFEMEKPFKDKKKSAWEIVPDKDYAAKIEKTTPKGDMPPDACGDYGLPVDSRAYFEFHENNRKTFAWVLVGQDTPLFDEQSLEF